MLEPEPLTAGVGGALNDDTGGTRLDAVEGEGEV